MKVCSELKSYVCQTGRICQTGLAYALIWTVPTAAWPRNEIIQHEGKKCNHARSCPRWRGGPSMVSAIVRHRGCGSTASLHILRDNVSRIRLNLQSVVDCAHSVFCSCIYGNGALSRISCVPMERWAQHVAARCGLVGNNSQFSAGGAAVGAVAPHVLSLGAAA